MAKEHSVIAESEPSLAGKIIKWAAVVLFVAGGYFLCQNQPTKDSQPQKPAIDSTAVKDTANTADSTKAQAPAKKETRKKTRQKALTKPASYGGFRFDNAFAVMTRPNYRQPPAQKDTFNRAARRVYAFL